MNCSIIFDGLKYIPSGFIQLNSRMNNDELTYFYKILNKSYKNIGDHICQILFRIKSLSVKKFVEEKWRLNNEYQFLFLLGESKKGNNPLLLGIMYYYMLPNRMIYLDVICTLKNKVLETQPIADGIKCKLGMLMLNQLYYNMKLMDTDKLILKSNDEKSDGFYRHIGFMPYDASKNEYIKYDPSSNYFQFILL